MRDSATRLHVFHSSASSPHLTHLTLSVQGLRPVCRWNGGEGPDASSTLGSDEAGDDDMDKVTRTAIARAYEIGRGDGGGESGVREGGEGEGKGRGGGGWLSGHSAAAPEVPQHVESESADRGVRGGSKDESAKRYTGEEEGMGGDEEEEEEEEEEDKAEGDW
jgi:hypothetical protein